MEGKIMGNLTGGFEKERKTTKEDRIEEGAANIKHARKKKNSARRFGKRTPANNTGLYQYHAPGSGGCKNQRGARHREKRNPRRNLRVCRKKGRCMATLLGKLTQKKKRKPIKLRSFQGGGGRKRPLRNPPPRLRKKRREPKKKRTGSGIRKEDKHKRRAHHSCWGRSVEMENYSWRRSVLSKEKAQKKREDRIGDSQRGTAPYPKIQNRRNKS